VPIVDADGDIERDNNGEPRMVTTVRLTFRELLPEDHEYQLPPFDRESLSRAKKGVGAARRTVDDSELRLAAVQLVAGSEGHRMRSFPDDDLLGGMGPCDADDRWLHFACGVLGRRFKLSPRTVRSKLIPVFRRDNQDPVPGYMTSSVKDGLHGHWYWRSIPDLPAEGSQDSEPAF